MENSNISLIKHRTTQHLIPTNQFTGVNMSTTKEQAIHFRDNSIVPALDFIGLNSDAAVELLLGTALQESRLLYRKQLRGGPARGFFQMEPATHDDIWNNYLRYHKTLAASVIGLLDSPKDNKYTALENNDQYAAAMARIHYKRAPEALPASGDIAEIANYWKKYYNTPMGAGTPSEFEANWRAVMG